MLYNFSIPEIIALINALAKLHNFCINKKEGVTDDSILNVEKKYMMTDEGGYIETENNIHMISPYLLWMTLSGSGKNKFYLQIKFIFILYFF